MKNKIKKQIEKDRNIVDEIMAYEGGEMTEKQALKMFQKMVKTGMAWKLQGHYGRTAKRLIEKGLIKQ